MNCLTQNKQLFILHMDRLIQKIGCRWEEEEEADNDD